MVELDEVLWRSVLSETAGPPELPIVVCGVDGESTFGMIRRGAVDESIEDTMLEALRSAGVEVPSSCESGTCGSCKVGYRDGSVSHRDYFLSASERSRFMTVCVSRTTSDVITLDL